ncbi:MAG: iron chelate uptake ABC transporter family permease subunit [Halobacteriota archaeon]
MTEEAKKATYLTKFLQWKMIMVYLIAILCVTIVLATAIGNVYIPPLEIVSLVGSKFHLCESSSTPSDEIIILLVRLPRIFLGLLVGFALATAGTAMQGLFKNPMADPYILGIASGAGVGAVFSMLKHPSFFSVYTTPFMAFVGAMFATLMVYHLAQMRGKIAVDTLLLTGIAVNLFLSAILAFMMYIAGHDLGYIYTWLMGRIDSPNWTEVEITTFSVFLCFIMIYLLAKDLNAMLLGEESARTLGINVEHVKKILLVLTAFITAAAVSFAGTIGFIGLIIPHITRILVGPDHRILLPASALVGGIFLVWADALIRLLDMTILSIGEMPVGIITAFFGAPFFIYLLRERKTGYYYG